MQLLSSSDDDIAKAAEAIKAGGLVAFPTETVYGLGADAFNPAALARIFEAKNRPRFDPLIVHIAESGALSRIADTAAMSSSSKEKLFILIEQLWPGPLTLVLPKRPELPDLATAGLATAAVRLPSHPAAQKLIRLSTGAVAAPSANLFGCLSPTRAEHVMAQLGAKIDFVIDGGKTPVGVESTVLDLSRDTPSILRPGGTSREAIEALIGPVELSTALPADSHGTQGSPSAPRSPGQLKSHYSPHTPLVLCRRGELIARGEYPNRPPNAAQSEGRLYFSPPGNGELTPSDRVLSATGDTLEAAANLFDMLHELDSLGLELIRAEEAPETGLGLAINDRLRRAAD